jgi:hypothetical protein
VVVRVGHGGKVIPVIAIDPISLGRRVDAWSPFRQERLNERCSLSWLVLREELMVPGPTMLYRCGNSPSQALKSATASMLSETMREIASVDQDVAVRHLNLAMKMRVAEEHKAQCGSPCRLRRGFGFVPIP